jgi:hypothetical protein
MIQESIRKTSCLWICVTISGVFPSRKLGVVKMKLVLPVLTSLMCSMCLYMMPKSHLPGKVVSLQDQRSFSGMACGEFAGSTGDCTIAATECLTKPTTRPGGNGVDCVTVGQACGACTGNANTTCQGGYDPAGTQYCGITPATCCPPSITCVNGGVFFGWTCDCTGPAGPPAGLRTIAYVNYNVPSGCP